MFGGLLVGYEPVGGDPDRMFRPIKAELAVALRDGRVPFWSERLGLGVPLVAESQVAAFYPPNWLLYRVLSVSAAYRVSMWLHCVAIAAATFAYARHIGLGGWGSAVSALTFPFCGFLTVHSSHEWAYHTLAYLPLCLLAADRYVDTGKVEWLAAFALLWGIQISLGHFQVQMWTGALAVALGLWRVIAERLPVWRILGLVLGLIWAAAVSAVQIVPTWELAKLAGQTRHKYYELSYFAYPPGHWAELAVPGLFRNLVGGGEGPYWSTQRTTSFEACLFVGTVPLLLATVGALAGGRPLTPWRLAILMSFALATMPHWWPRGFAAVLRLPGLGYFRSPARYTAVTSFGLAILAGSGLDRAIASERFRAGLRLAVALVFAAFVWASVWTLAHSSLFAAVGDATGMFARLGLAALTWALAFWVVVRWRQKQSEGAWLVLLVTAVELGAFYYAGGTTRWGATIPLPTSSPVLSLLAREPGVVRVAGQLDNLPLRAGAATAAPYTGFSLVGPHLVLKAAQDPRTPDERVALCRLRRYGVTHFVRDTPPADQPGEVVFHGDDPALDVLAYRPPGSPGRREWWVVRLSNVFPQARVALRAFTATDTANLLETLSGSNARDEAWFLPGDAPNESGSPRARSARVLRWAGLSGEVEHDGTCDLILMRAYYPGWIVKVGEKTERPVGQADGGLIAVRLEGAGVDRVVLQFRPKGFVVAAMLTVAATAVALGYVIRLIINRTPPAEESDRPLAN
jgi:hypothetical protein